MGIIRDVDIGRECGAFISKVVEEGINLGYCSFQTELGASPKKGAVEMDITALEEGKEGTDFLVRGDMFN